MSGQTPASKTIAVLPFVNMSSSKENEYFSDGMTEEIINALAKISSLKVTSRTSSFFFKNKNIPVSKIGASLNVSTILEGSVRLAGQKMRITAQLIDVADDFHFWSETFDRSVEDIFAVQDEISLLIADKLREHIGHFDIEDQLVDSPDIPVAVYQKYLQGRYHLMKLNLEGTEKSIEIFQEVISDQAGFAPAYLAINQGYAYLGAMGLMPAMESFMKAQPYLKKAIELGEDLAETQLNLAWIACWQDWDLESAYRHVFKAIDIQPSDQIYLSMSNLLTVEGKFEAAHYYIDKALQIDPLSAMNHHYKGFLYFLEERYEQGVPLMEKSLKMKADLPFPNMYLGQSLILSGKPQESLAFFQALPEDAKGDLTRLGGICQAQIALGNTGETEVLLAKVEKALQTDAMAKAMIVLIQAKCLQGQYEAAVKLIESGVQQRIPLMLLLNTDPLLKPLRSRPRFQELMREALGERTGYGIPKKKYKKSLLNEQMMEQYREQLERLMSEDKPFLDPGLTLRTLAEMLDIPPNHMSQLLNEGFDKNFAEYINTFRLEAFKAKASDPAQQHLTILALAYDSGFNSKTVFNTFFKKTMGKTPSAYWKEVVQ